ncbi:MAG: AI-2E family transporter [Cellulosilyticaceae bacterium]
MKDLSLKKIFMIITYCFLLTFLVVRFNSIWGFATHALNLTTPFFVGLAIAFILNKPMLHFRRLYKRFLQREGLINTLAIITAYILFVLTLVAIFTFIIPQLIINIRNFFVNLGDYLTNVENFLIKIMTDLHLTSSTYTKLFEQFNTVIKDIATFTLSYLKNLIPQLANFTSSIVGLLFNTIIAVVVSINLLAGKEKLLAQGKQITYTYLPHPLAARIEYVFKLSADIFSKYVMGQLMEACILGGLCFIGMKIFGFEYAILISTLVAVTALIPVMGAYLGGGVAFVLLAMISPVKALLFLVYLAILQQLENSIIYPRVVGSSIGLPGLWVIFAVTVGGGLFGFVGILISVPIMSILYALIKEDVMRKKTKSVVEV